MTAWAYYNEHDAYPAQWLRNLIAAGHIAPGEVDERSITEVQPDDLSGFTQCHFFAGIGGWSLAARLAGISDNQPLWTGSPPCQDVSVAGAIWGVRSGLDGERTSLVRKWLALVGHHKPGKVSFENVRGIAPWVAEIERCLEGFGYSISRPECSSADIGAPHLRRREWRIANRDGTRWEECRQTRSRAPQSDPRRAAPGDVWFTSTRRSCGLDDGFPARVAAIRAYGNAIDPWVAAKILRESLIA